MMGVFRALLFLLALATPAVAATPFWATTFDAGRTDTVGGVPPAGAGSGHFDAGVSALPPVYRANNRLVSGYTSGAVYYPSFTPVFPGTGNRAFLDLDSSSAPGDRYGMVALSGTPNPVSVGAITLPILAPYGQCVGGSRRGSPCLVGGTQLWNQCPNGWCQTPRAPVLSFIDSGGVRGCTVFASQACNSENGVDLAGTCDSPRITYDVLYGSPQDAYVGRCGASKTMTDTVCGGACASASDCIQGRPTEAGTATATQCIRDDTGATCSTKRCVGGANDSASCTVDSQCPSGICGGCHCINECDEENSNEATCEARTFATITRQPRQNYVVVLEQDNASAGTAICRFRGGVHTSLCEGGTNAGGACASNADCPSSGVCTANRMQVFDRGIQTPQKLGVCTGGTEMADGGRNRTACATNADCACNTTWPTYNAGTCAAGTCATTGGTPLTPVTVPHRVVFGWNDGRSVRARIGIEDAKIETGASPTLNWRTETTTVSDPTADGSPSLTTSWTASGNGCASAYQCLGGLGDLTIEPDDPFTVGTVTRLQHTTSGAATHEWTWGDLAATNDTPIAVTMSVAAQDAEGSADTAASVQVALRRATGSTQSGVAFDLANFEQALVCDGGSNNGGTCATNADCPGASNACKSADGSSTPARAYPTRPLTLTKDPADNTTALSRTIINGLIGQVVKGTPHGLSNEPRVTFGALETFLSTVTPLKPAVLPRNKIIGFIGDSLTNDPIFFASFMGLNVEANRVYDQATGGRGMGNVDREKETLLAGNSGLTMSTVSIAGATGTPVDVAFVFATANTFHPLAFADPSARAAYGGIGQNGWCEQWSSGSGYGALQGRPCTCAETSNWYKGSILLTGISLTKNANFGTASAACTNGSTTECQLGGANPPTTITNATCSGGVCPNSGAGLSITSAAGTVGMLPTGCGNSPDCPGGVCVMAPTIADMLAAKRRFDAAAAANGTIPVWTTQPPPHGKTWWLAGSTVAVWNATLLADQKAIGGNWIDLDQYFRDVCGPSLLVRDASNACIKIDGIHHTPDGIEHHATLANACASNTTLDGVPNKTTDGVCAFVDALTCSAGRCASGLRIGATCSTDADCRYCSGGARGKLGRLCSSDDECGYYRCVF